ncbi:MAG: hypothetical protein HY403_00305, partial [Elusimicrobia bacterium]|nr:hypothetical protein [Elusimicrobiota bacterium]
MRRLILFLLAAAAFAPPSHAQDEYGSRGLFPVYQSGDQWLIFDKPRKSGRLKDLMPGSKFLIIGSRGADLFLVGRASATYGGACRNKKPLKLRAALLKGPRSAVGQPVMAIKVANHFRLKGSRARYDALANAVNEPLYQLLSSTLAAAAIEEAKAGAYRFRPDDEGAAAFLADPKAEKLAMKIDFAAHPPVSGLAVPTV